MLLKLMRGLWIWTGALALVLVLAILPLTPWFRALAALLIVSVVVSAWVISGRRAARRFQALVLAEDGALPPSGYRQPVVLVCGDGLKGLFGPVPDQALALRITAQGCYLLVPTLERLSDALDGVLAHRPHWGKQISALYIVNPAEQNDSAALAGRIRGFRHQVAIVRKRGIVLPLMLVSYQQAGSGEGSWFTLEAGQDGLSVCDAGARVSLAHWQSRPDDLSMRGGRLQASIQVSSGVAWLAQTVLPHLLSREQRDPPCPAVACAVTLVPTLPLALSGNLWLQWLRDKSGLNESVDPRASTQLQLPFPDPLLHLLPKQTEPTQVRQASLLALWLFVLASAIALASSAWQNHLLLRQVTDDLRRYHAIPGPEYPGQPEQALKEQAMRVLREDAVRLDQYYRQGAPLRLGLGLYTGEQLRPPLLAAIAGHRQPSLPSEQKLPDPVRLDSLSLFASGSAELKPGSTKVLINALVDIKAQPGWLIVIAGHTDATGDEHRNLLLSQARAGAVRDWMQKMGDIPDSCFAVQGFGASQPLGSNDTPDGRALNRRVDIRLVPEVGACVLPTKAAGGQLQSQLHQATLTSH